LAKSSSVGLSALIMAWAAARALRS
jgi:hypothetical protein